jgi:hypothetical protein
MAISLPDTAHPSPRSIGAFSAARLGQAIDPTGRTSTRQLGCLVRCQLGPG